MNDLLQSIRLRFTAFAKAHIAGRDLTTSVFPIDLWKNMAQSGLFAFDESERKNGVFLSLSVAAEALAEAGGNMGMALSWMMQRLIAENFITRFGTARQQASAELSTGTKTFCFAVSEPETGAHPKYLKTTATISGDHYIINGKKTFLTNGPIADLFMVVAITGHDGSRKTFTAFLVPKETLGLTITPMELPLLRPAPHGTLVLEDCPVPTENILGGRGSAFKDMVEPFRDVEDTLMMGILVGAMQSQLNQLVQLNKASDAADSAAGAIGQMCALINVERLLARKAAKMLDTNARGYELFSFHLVFKSLASQFDTLAEEIVPKDTVDTTLSALRNDFHQSIHIAERVARIKQKKIGERLLRGE